MGRQLSLVAGVGVMVVFVAVTVVSMVAEASMAVLAAVTAADIDKPQSC